MVIDPVNRHQKL